MFTGLIHVLQDGQLFSAVSMEVSISPETGQNTKRDLEVLKANFG